MQDPGCIYVFCDSAITFIVFIDFRKILASKVSNLGFKQLKKMHVHKMAMFVSCLYFIQVSPNK